MLATLTPFIPTVFTRVIMRTILSVPPFRMSIDAPVVVIGDRSQSMAIAVQTSTIIASLICAIAKAELCFFNRTNHHPPVMPRTIEEV